eukprot:3714990-Amphidinium_carterae.1
MLPDLTASRSSVLPAMTQLFAKQDSSYNMCTKSRLDIGQMVAYFQTPHASPRTVECCLFLCSSLQIFTATATTCASSPASFAVL